MTFDRKKYNAQYYQCFRKGSNNQDHSLMKRARVAYSNAKGRCNNPNNPNYHIYGGKGVKLLLSKEEWIEIYTSAKQCALCGNILIDDGRKPSGRSIDRINSNGHYEKDNVRIVCRSCTPSARGRTTPLNARAKGLVTWEPELEAKIQNLELQVQALEQTHLTPTILPSSPTCACGDKLKGLVEQFNQVLGKVYKRLDKLESDG